MGCFVAAPVEGLDGDFTELYLAGCRIGKEEKLFDIIWIPQQKSSHQHFFNSLKR